MLRVEYSPYGIVHSDFTFLEDAREVWRQAQGKDMEYVTATSNIIDGFRLLYKRGEIDNKGIVFVYNEHTIQLTKDCMMSHWPDGFCDWWDKILTEIY